ncbi:MAG: lytic transglycosylase domain-containing protein [Chakrabartia sp.]
MNRAAFQILTWSFLVAAAACVPILPFTGTAVAQAQSPVAEADSGFRAFAQELKARAAAQGISSSTLDAVIPSLTYQPRVIALDRSQPGGPPNGPIPKFAPYRATHVDAARINRGRARYVALRPLLQRVEQETGVPESIMLAIYGHETNYGAYSGGFDLLDALATLAFEGRRRDLFADEFIATLRMMDMGFARSQLRGSWAGATGYPQFLPSVYLRVARDGDGDGRADIWRSEADALASIANYFANAGWRPGQPWGVPAALPDRLDWASLEPQVVSPNCPRVHNRHSRWKTVAEWAALGVRPTRAGLEAGDLVSLFQPDGPGTPAWLLTGNYRVILDYNCSNFYALSVGLLADAVETGTGS